ncbi:MAG: type IX secretion system protein PorQ [Bacteroidota bacterium]
MPRTLHLSSLFLFAFLCWSSLPAQVSGGDNVYEFLNLSPSARVSGLAGALISVRDDDVTLAQGNPALLNPKMHQQISVNHSFFLADIQHGYVAYGHEVPSLEATFHAGLQYVNYGNFDAADEFGQINGDFKAAEYALTLGGAKQIYDRLALGANVRLINSQLESYDSYGISADLGAYYQDSTGRFSASFVLRNMGAQLSTYREANQEELPFDIQIGISQKLKHLPFRFSIIYHNLQRWNILYDDPNNEEGTLFLGSDEQQGDDAFGDFVDNFFRHFIFNGEFLFGKKENFRLRVGYSHMRNQEMTVRSFRSLAGFAFGFGMKVNRFRIEYGRNVQHLAGGSNHFSISTALSEFRR